MLRSGRGGEGDWRQRALLGTCSRSRLAEQRALLEAALDDNSGCAVM